MLGTDEIWVALRHQKFSARKIAQDLGVATSTVARAINGDTRTPDPRIMARIAEVLGVPLEILAPGTRSHLLKNAIRHSHKRSMSDFHEKQTTCPGQR
jgi:transcriptional regulator with XRE-family HTH domain